MCAGTAVSCCCRVSVYIPPSSLPKEACTHTCAQLESILYPHRCHPAGWKHYSGRQSVWPCCCSEHHRGSTGSPGGIWATTSSCAESRRQLGFCKQSWCPLYNLFTGALGRSGRGASGTHHAERICLACRFPCPGKALQAGTCTPSCTAICLAATAALVLPDRGCLTGSLASMDHAGLCSVHHGENPVSQPMSPQG